MRKQKGQKKMKVGSVRNLGTANYSADLNEKSKPICKTPEENKLERTPKEDAVYFTGSKKEKVLGGVNVDVDDSFWSGNRTIKGELSGKTVDLKVCKGTFTDNVKLTGTIDGKPVELKLKGYKLTGDLSDEDKKLVPYLRKFMSDKRAYDMAAEEAAATAFLL